LHFQSSENPAKLVQNRARQLGRLPRILRSDIIHCYIVSLLSLASICGRRAWG